MQLCKILEISKIVKVESEVFIIILDTLSINNNKVTKINKKNKNSVSGKP